MQSSASLRMSYQDSSFPQVDQGCPQIAHFVFGVQESTTTITRSIRTDVYDPLHLAIRFKRIVQTDNNLGSGGLAQYNTYYNTISSTAQSPLHQTTTNLMNSSILACSDELIDDVKLVNIDTEYIGAAI